MSGSNFELEHPSDVMIRFRNYKEEESLTVHVNLTGVQFSFGNQMFWILHSDLQMIEKISEQLKSWKSET